jgi:hypothetical protein
VPLLSFIQDPLEQGHYIKKLIQQYDVSERDVRGMLKPQKIIDPAKPLPALKVPSFALEKEVLGGVLAYQDFLEEVRQKGSIKDFENLEIQEIIKSIFLGGMEKPEFDKGSTIAKEAVFMVESQLGELEGNEEAFKRGLHKSFAQLRLHSIKKQQQQIGAEIKTAETALNRAKLSELNKQFAELSEKRMEFEKMV